MPSLVPSGMPSGAPSGAPSAIPSQSSELPSLVPSEVPSPGQSDIGLRRDLLTKSSGDVMEAFSVKSVSESESSNEPMILSFTVIDTSRNAELRQISGGSDPVDIYVGDLGAELTLRANTNPGAVSQVRFFVNGSLLETDSEAPFALGGDIDGRLKPSSIMAAVAERVRIQAVPMQAGVPGSEFEVVLNIRSGSAPVSCSN